MKMLWIMLGIAIVTGAGSLADEATGERFGPSARPTKSVAQSVPGEGYYDANDYYYYQGKRIPLHRSLTEYAVLFRAGIEKAARQDIVRSLFPTRDITDVGQVRGRRLSIVKLSKVSRRTAIEEAANAARAEPRIQFAFPVFIHPKTRTRMVLTDEIVVKLKPGHQIEDVTKAYASYGLVVVKKMWGTKDEYILGIQEPNTVNPLEAANALSESDLVEWAEPNFMQEYRRSFIPNRGPEGSYGELEKKLSSIQLGKGSAVSSASML